MDRALDEQTMVTQHAVGESTTRTTRAAVVDTTRQDRHVDHDDDRPLPLRWRAYLADNWAVVLATVLLTLVMLGAVATLF